MNVAASLFGAAWEVRRRLYARGWLAPRRVASRVISVGNLTVGGTGKTTLVLHLVRLAHARGMKAAVVARDYHPGPDGRSDESILYTNAFGAERVFTGRRKLEQAMRAAAAGCSPIVVDDGFSTWALERDLDIVLLDAQDLWGGGRLLPAGRLREPRRALQRAEVVVISRLARGADPSPWIAEARRYAPAATFAAGRHRVTGARRLGGAPVAPGGRVRVVTATGSPEAVAVSAAEAGFEVTGLARYRDHHWFSAAEARLEGRLAGQSGSQVLVTAKDAVRWPAAVTDPSPLVLEVEWSWVSGGEAVEQRALAVSAAAPAQAGV